MFTLLWNLSAALHGYLRAHMPTNRLVDRLQSQRGHRWAIPVILIVAPSYLFAMCICATLVERGGPDYLNLLVLLFAWNAIKFAAAGVLLPLSGRHRVGHRSGSDGRNPVEQVARVIRL